MFNLFVKIVYSQNIDHEFDHEIKQTKQIVYCILYVNPTEWMHI